MSKNIISTDKAPQAIVTYSQAVRDAGLVFISGQIPLDPETMPVVEGGVGEQPRPVLRTLPHVLAADAARLGVRLLTEEERHKHLARLVGWTMVPGREAITRDFLFDDFKAAFSYMTEVALEAEKSDHHP